MNGEQGASMVIDTDSIVLKDGFSYILVDHVPAAYRLLKKYSDDQRGMCISRVPPGRIREDYGIGDITFRWLTHIKSEESVRPTDLHILFPQIQSFMGGGNFVILLDGLEYIKVHNGFDETLKFIQSFRDHVYLEKGILLMPVAHDALTPMEIALMRRELMPIEDVVNEQSRSSNGPVHD